MAFLRLRNLSVEFPVYQGGSQSLKKMLFNATTQGNLARDAMDHELRERITGRRHSTAFHETVVEIIAAFGPRPGPAADVDQLVISLLGLCLFPLEHDSTLVAGMGYSAHSSGFSARRAAHIVDLVARALAPAGGPK